MALCFISHDPAQRFNRMMVVYYGLRSLAAEPATVSARGAVHADVAPD